MTDRYVVDLGELDKAQVALAGGKGANLGELRRVEGVAVPAGFCVTTSAFTRVTAASGGLRGLAGQLARLDPGDQAGIAALSEQARRAIEAAPVPDDLAAAIVGALAALGEQAAAGGPVACAVRSSATAEDLPGASFAGQHDSYLNVTGPAEVLAHVRRCWASLFSERAVTYRLRGGFRHAEARMAVIVQAMVAPQAAGVVFTADPVTSNRKVCTVEATVGLGEALVSGLVSPDAYRVRDGRVIAREVAAKRRAVLPRPGGGTQVADVEAGRQREPALSDAQVLELARLARRVEAHFGQPQDIEWCLAGGQFLLVQARPVTTLFPVPRAADDGNHVYVSVGHQQMMTDPMKPLGLSMWQLTALRPMPDAGGRLFVDVTRELGSPATRAGLVTALGTSDPLIGDALQAVIDRGDFIPQLPGEDSGTPPGRAPAWRPAASLLAADPAVVARLTERSEASLAALRRDIRGTSGPELLDFIAADIAELKQVLRDPDSLRVIQAAMQAAAWLNENLLAWAGERNAADVLSQSVPGNVTAQMGLDLLGVADAVRPYPEVAAFLQRAHDAGDEDFLDGLPALRGGRQARDAIAGYLASYGMRCVGEIDITRPRWSERPTALVPMILSNVANAEPGAGQRRFARGLDEAREAEQRLLAALRNLPDGAAKAAEAKAMIDRVRAFAGYREYPKYHIVCRYFAYKQALAGEAARLARAGVLRQPGDACYLTFAELREAARTGALDGQLVGRRKQEFRAYQALTPPRVLTSEGEAVAGSYRRGGLPDGALPGQPVCAGIVEGRARVVADLADAALQAGDILVTPYTDPSWTPAFVTAAALVTEAGGLMTHGAVIAREYGLPAVVGVQDATRLIRDGQRILVHGTDGYVQVLP